MPDREIIQAILEQNGCTEIIQACQREGTGMNAKRGYVPEVWKTWQ